MEINDFIGRLAIKMAAQQVDKNPHMDVKSAAGMDHWRCTFRRPGSRAISVVFSMGHGHHGRAPHAAEVLDCLASDAATADGNTFEEWAEEIGENTDSRAAERTYQVIVRQSAALRRFLGAVGFQTLLYELDRL